MLINSLQMLLYSEHSITYRTIINVNHLHPLISDIGLVLLPDLDGDDLLLVEDEEAMGLVQPTVMEVPLSGG